MRAILLVLVLTALTGCASGSRNSVNSTAVPLVDPLTLSQATALENQSYRIGVGDTLRLTVFQVAELSADSLRVDAAGNIQAPLIGMVRAQGKSATELAAEIQSALGRSYLQNPRVGVTVTDAASQKVTLDGAVVDPGVYEMSGRTTLMQAVAMAKGPGRGADTRSVAVFRTVGEQQMVAVFDLAAIRAGQAVDPVLQGDDIVVVDTNRLSVLFREALAALPAVGTFALLQ